MSHTRSSLSVLRELINMVDNRYLRIQLASWVEGYVREFGIQIEVPTHELEMIKGDKEKFMEYRKRQLAHEIGKQMLDECASEVTYDTPYSQRTTYRLFGIKRLANTDQRS